MGDGALLFPLSVCVCVSPCQGYVVARTLGCVILPPCLSGGNFFARLTPAKDQGVLRLDGELW